MTRYQITYSDESGAWGREDTIEVADMAAALARGAEIAETDLRDNADAYRSDGEAISIRVRIDAINLDQYEDDTTDTYEQDSDRITVDIEADHATLIRAAVGRHSDCVDCEHDWVADKEEGCRENPGVWSLGGTTIQTREYCLRCGLVHTHVSLGSQRNPGEADDDTYEMADEDVIAAVRRQYGHTGETR